MSPDPKIIIFETITPLASDCLIDSCFLDKTTSTEFLGFPTFQIDVQMQSSMIDNVLQGFYFVQKTLISRRETFIINKKHLVVPLGVFYQ